MLAKAPEKRVRQKPRRRMRADVNPEAALEYFQISVNILEARNLAWANSQTVNTYVVVMLGKEKYRTNVRKNLNEPRYKEYLLFEWYTTMKELQQAKLWLAVMEPRCYAPPRLLGETSIDLGVIWAQTNHQVFHKWAQLSLPRDPSAGTVGFLKVDISILCRGDVQAMPVMVSPEKLGQDLLHAGSEQQTANYLITVYNAFGIFGPQAERRHGKLPSTYVKVSFCGLSTKTAVRHSTNNPSYCEQISITEVFPNICQTVRFEVCSAEPAFNKTLASVELNLVHISHDGENGFVPTFGPSLLHMYGPYGEDYVGSPGEDGPFYRGSLLVALKMFLPYMQVDFRTTTIEPVPPLSVKRLWPWDEICIFCPILEISMLDRQMVDKLCGAAITIGEINIDNNAGGDFMLMQQEIKKRKLHYTGPIDIAKSKAAYGHLSFSNAFPVLQLTTLLPDFRFRIYRNNMVQKIASTLESALIGIENRIKRFEYTHTGSLLEELREAIDRTVGSILKYFDIVQMSESRSDDHGDSEQYTTDLDQKQLTLQREELEKVYHQLKKNIRFNSSISLLNTASKIANDSLITKKNVKCLLLETKVIAEKLKSLTFKAAQGWPDLVLWLLNDGSRFAYCKISTPDIIFSEIPEQSGENCGKIQTVYMKPIKCVKHMKVPNACSCIAGKLEVLIWMGRYSERLAFECFLPDGFKIKIRDQDMCVKAEIVLLECRVYIHRAKMIGFELFNSPSPFVRVNMLNICRDSKVEQKTVSPVWNQVLIIRCMIRTSTGRMKSSPPKLLVEVLDYDSLGGLEVLGRSEINPVFCELPDTGYNPKLKWYDLRKDHENVGQILISAKIQQIPETILKSTIYGSLGDIDEANVQDLLDNVDSEEIPPGIQPRYCTYKVDIYWWGLRDVNCAKKPCAVLEIDDLVVKSDVIAENSLNCNFPNGRISHTFESHLEECYSPPLTIKLYDSSTFGRTIFLGTNAVKNPTRYLVNWLSKYERDVSLKSASITTKHFIKVSDDLFVKKSNITCDITSGTSKMTINSSMVDRKKRSWKRLFCSREPDEEEYVLLPMYVKEKEQLKIMRKNSEPEYQDWWSRFFSSTKRFGDESNQKRDIKVYDTELEAQPEFEKFKDWCQTLKLYNAQKCGMTDKDQSLRCGYLKAGIAIYKWPPPLNTVAVNNAGVDLHIGYFNDHPCNDPAKFLIRVYTVRGLNLTAKDFKGKCDPYVIIKCGSKKAGDREQYLENTVNPTFGRTYEFRCSLPEDYLMTLSVFDHDSAYQDVLIGSTNIDLEDRIYSKHRGLVGLSHNYNATGTSKWRDIKKPSDILEEVCAKNHLQPPTFPDGNTVIVNGVEYRDNDKSNRTYISASEKRENICLNLLHEWHTLSVCGYHLVPEHVETRKLFNPEKPGIEQGKIQMWVDIFQLNSGLYVPIPIDITPHKVEDYELRVIIWHVQNVRADSVSPSKGLDLYVKAWIGNIEQAHYTDIHYNSINGDATFNWRMIFNFQYQHSEKKLIKVEKSPFTEVEEYLPPVLVVQVADSYAASIDDYLGTLNLDLNAIPHGTKHNIQRNFTLTNSDNLRKINLFSTKSIRSWWPLKAVDQKTDSMKLAGMIDLEMHLLPKHKAIIMPAGLGRNPPFPLPEPNRPEAYYFNSMKSTFQQNVFNRNSVEYSWAAAVALGILFCGAIVYWELPNIVFGSLIG